MLSSDPTAGPHAHRVTSGLRQAIEIYGRHRVGRMAAALAFYGIFSLGPLLVLAFTIAGWIVGTEAAEGLVASQIADFVGIGAASTVERLLEASARGGSGITATIIAGLVLFYIGSTVFFQLQAALAEIFDAPSEVIRGWQVALWRRLRGFLAVLVIAAVVVVMVLVNLVVVAAMDVVVEQIAWVDGAARWATPTVALAVLVLLVAAMYHWLTSVRVPWRAALTGAAITAVLLLTGAWALGLYFGSLGEHSGAYAAFPLLLLLALFNYLSQAFLFGAVLTKVLVDRSAWRRTAVVAEPTV